MKAFRDKQSRDAFVASHIRKGLALRIRNMRKARGWNQTELAAAVGSDQRVISLFESGDYEGYTVRSLLRLAAALDVALVVDLVPLSEFLRRLEALSAEDMTPPMFEDDPGVGSVTGC
jgi:transcriptional regulator with XRE-family HTH domain